MSNDSNESFIPVYNTSVSFNIEIFRCAKPFATWSNWHLRTRQLGVHPGVSDPQSYPKLKTDLPHRPRLSGYA